MAGATAPFAKMNGIGNEIIIADLRGHARRVSEQAAISLAAPDAIPFDQIMEIADPTGEGRDFDVRIFNSDASLAGACGNGTRCMVAWLHEQTGRKEYKFLIAGRVVSATLREDALISVDMGMPKFGWQDIPLKEEFGDTTGIELQIGPIDAPVLHTPSVVNVGNPHAVFWVEDDVASYDLERFGPLLENHPIFPDRANISVARVLAPDHIEVRTWERGAGLTKACGSAACAALVCAARKGISNRSAKITLPGGDLLVEWLENNSIRMSGPVEFEYDGEFDPVTGQFSRTAAIASSA